MQCRVNEQTNLLNVSLQQFFNYVSRRLHPTNTARTLQEAEKTLVNAQDICNCFAVEFQKNFSHDSTLVENEFNLPTIDKLTFDYMKIDINTVNEILNSQRNLAADPDGISDIFYKRLIHELSFPLTITF